MNPGYDLDALIAEKIFDYRWEGQHLVSPRFTLEQWLEGHYQIPPYSTDIAAAWEVVENLTANRPPHFELTKGYYGWTAGFDLDRPFKRVLASADTAPMAICLAALKALGVTT